MRRIALVVEGQSDRESLPIIIRRIAHREGVFDLKIVGPYRVSRYKIVRPGELERIVELAARTLAGAGGILVAVDADDDPPCRLGPELSRRAATARSDLPSRVVLATREKEAWFLAALESLRGKHGVPLDADSLRNAETIRGAKARIASLTGRSYSEVADEPALSASFDLDQARQNSRSFDKLYRSVTELLAAQGSAPGTTPTG